MTTDRQDGLSDQGLRPHVFDSLRQLLYPSEIRIALPRDAQPAAEARVVTAPSSAGPAAATDPAHDVRIDRMLADVATCLWYLKTKHFKRAWDSEDRDEDDPRARRALGRLNMGLAALAAGGIEIQDPTNRRYPPGSGDLMKPVQLQPTPGLTVEKVVETVKPIVFRQGRLIQQGEVFVAVPEDGAGQESGERHQTPAPEVNNCVGGTIGGEPPAASTQHSTTEPASSEEVDESTPSPEVRRDPN